MRREARCSTCAATGDVARTLRVARSQAIASNRRVVVLFDMGRRHISVDGAVPRALPYQLGMSVVGQAGGGARDERQFRSRRQLVRRAR